jgi:hypothetical protein
MSVLIKMPDGTASVTVNGVELSLVDGLVEVDNTSTVNLLLESFGGILVDPPPTVLTTTGEEVVTDLGAPPLTGAGKAPEAVLPKKAKK